MRWIKKEPIPLGAKRLVKRFLFFPKTFGLETRWLEFSYLWQKMIATHHINLEEVVVRITNNWENIGFAKDDEISKINEGTFSENP